MGSPAFCVPLFHFLIINIITALNVALFPVLAGRRINIYISIRRLALLIPILLGRSPCTEKETSDFGKDVEAKGQDEQEF
jgi:hypothetical protein